MSSMAMLGNFENASLAEKILMLDGIETAHRVEAISELEAIFRSPKLDDAVQHSVSDTLRALFARSEEETVKGLDSADPRIRRMCTQIAGQMAFASATSALLRLASEESDPDQLLHILSALAARRRPEVLGVCRRFVHHEDAFVAAAAVQMLGDLGDVESMALLSRLVDQADSADRFEFCDVATEKAIGALAALGTDDAISFLVTKLHHRNPTARRFVQENLLKIGPKAIPFVAELFDGENVDEQVLAANLIGLIGDRKGGDVLVEAFDRKATRHPNLRFAIYEALGKVRSLKGLVCLMDGLAEEDPVILMGVVSALNHQVSPTVVAKIRSLLLENVPAGARIVDAIVAARATDIFEALHEDPRVSDQIATRVGLSNDPEVISAFRERLAGMDGDRARSDAAKLDPSKIRRRGKKLLAVDDSKSMLLFYQSIAADMELEVTTAGNGKEALDLLDQGRMFDLIITDLNMPIMDGIEFSRKVRASLFGQATPILMATTESESSQRSLADRAGVSGFVNKPIKADVLKQSIQSYL